MFDKKILTWSGVNQNIFNLKINDCIKIKTEMKERFSKNFLIKAIQYFYCLLFGFVYNLSLKKTQCNDV